MKHKVCTNPVCSETRISEFGKDNYNLDGLNRQCKSCRNKDNRNRYIPVNTRGMKVCTGCGEEKNIKSNFTKSKSTKDGYSYRCKGCSKLDNAESKLRNEGIKLTLTQVNIILRLINKNSILSLNPIKDLLDILEQERL